MSTLPQGYGVRRATEADAQTIHSLVSAYQSAVTGRPDYTLEDVVDELAEPDFDLTRDGWLVFEGDTSPDSRLVGWGWACRDGDSDIVNIDVFSSDDEVAAWLWATVQVRAAEIAGALGHSMVTIDAGIHRGNLGSAARLAGDDFSIAATYHRLRIDHSGPIPAPSPPAGFVVRNAGADSPHPDTESIRRGGHAVYEAASADHFGHVTKPYAAWAQGLAVETVHDWSYLDVLYTAGGPAGDDGEPVAMVLRSRQFVPDENCGYVRELAVRPDRQARGLGRFLLRYAFAADAAAGYTGTILHVDTNPQRPALGLYLSEGMRPIEVIDIWRRTAPAIR